MKSSADPKPIAFMQKVTLQIAMTQAHHLSGPTAPATPYTFIYGIGAQGLSPFEQALSERRPGEELTFEVHSDQWQAFWGHLSPCHIVERPSSASCQLKIRVLAVEPAASREVVKALAQSSACGEGCGGGDCCSH
jgi:hypothetical protein